MESINHELYENARRRIKQKRNLYLHFVLFFVGSIFLIILNKLFKIDTYISNWSYWIILLWSFLFILHFINVFITKRFMNKEWERKEIDKLVEKQKRKIEQLQIHVVDNLKEETKTE